MSVLHITKDTFEAEVLKSDKPVLLDFFAVKYFSFTSRDAHVHNGTAGTLRLYANSDVGVGMTVYRAVRVGGFQQDGNSFVEVLFGIRFCRLITDGDHLLAPFRFHGFIYLIREPIGLGAGTAGIGKHVYAGECNFFHEFTRGLEFRV